MLSVCKVVIFIATIVLMAYLFNVLGMPPLQGAVVAALITYLAVFWRVPAEWENK